MSFNPLATYLDAWTIQAVVASRWLTRLYRALGDKRQVTTAILAGAPAAERLDRSGPQGRVASVADKLSHDHPEETQAEEAA